MAATPPLAPLLRCPASSSATAHLPHLLVRLRYPASSSAASAFVICRPLHTLMPCFFCHWQRRATRPLPLRLAKSRPSGGCSLHAAAAAVARVAPPASGGAPLGSPYGRAGKNQRFLPERVPHQSMKPKFESPKIFNPRRLLPAGVFNTAHPIGRKVFYLITRTFSTPSIFFSASTAC